MDSRPEGGVMYFLSLSSLHVRSEKMKKECCLKQRRIKYIVLLAHYFLKRSCIYDVNVSFRIQFSKIGYLVKTQKTYVYHLVTTLIRSIGHT